MSRTRLALAMAGLVLTLAACSSVSSLPTYEVGATAPTGVIEGVLLRRADCVYIQADGTLLVLWPRGYARLGQQVLEDGNPMAQIGEQVRIFGGSVSADHYRSIRSTIGGSPIPAGCETDFYWMATGVDREPRPTP